ncbi:MAG: hypothetical protein L0216_16880 [Planctomycetales bacterium]|nr:hypothetical protein [Planctomycetales bacterium]
MQELHEKNKDKGLVVLAPHVQQATREQLEAYVLKYGITYPVALNANTSAYSTGSIPQAAVIGPDGTVVWKGTPGGPEQKVIEEQLRKVDLFGERALVASKEGKPIATQVLQGKYGAAVAELKKAGTGASAEMAATLGRLEAYAKKLLEQAKKAQADGDYPRATELAGEVERKFKGSDLEAEAKALVADVKKAADYKKVLQAAAMWAQLGKQKKKDDIQKMAQQLAQSFADTFFGKRADAVARNIQAVK